MKAWRGRLLGEQGPTAPWAIGTHSAFTPRTGASEHYTGDGGDQHGV